MISRTRVRSRTSDTARTVGDTLKSLFPAGTIAERKAVWDECPLLPSDVFAGAALLLDRSGAYSALRIGRPNKKSSETRATLWLTTKQRDSAVLRGKKWHSDPKVPIQLRKWWKEVWASRNEPIFVGPFAVEPPEWWLPALLLLISADEASAGVGFIADGHPIGWFADIVTWAASKRSVMHTFDDDFGAVNVPIAGLHTIADRASPDVACVLPKSRTATVGSTLRSLSHHLSLLPPQGIVRTKWYLPQGAAKSQHHCRSFNLLLIPFPFTINAKSFRGSVIDRKVKKLGWFELNQDWLGRPEEKREHDLASYVASLVSVAEADVGEVHGIVFPELALNWEHYEVLRTHLLSSCKNVELLVSGLASYPVKDLHAKSMKRLLKRGNFAVTTCIHRVEDRVLYIEFGRAKHHRWRLDGPQISRYGIGAALDPAMCWWENIDLTWRELEVGVIRDNATVTSLICEDLARLDPSQIAVRTVGPTLVIALLMDGPQLAYRWAARNATVLAEDPGSSVLTFTSMGLIDRMNRAGSSPENRCVGLWRDDKGVQRELHLKKDSDAILLSLTSGRRQEWSLDGRGDNHAAVGWDLSGERCISALARPSWIVPT